jgi:hypothetical protein
MEENRNMDRPGFGRIRQMPVYGDTSTQKCLIESRNAQMELKKDLVGEYTGSLAPSDGGSTLVVRNRTRIFESEKGHLSYVITEHITDHRRCLSRRDTYVGLVTPQVPSEEAGVFPLHLTPLDRPYREGNALKCEFLFSVDFNSYFLVFNWKEGPEQIQFRLRKASQNGTGRRRKLS